MGGKIGSEVIYGIFTRKPNNYENKTEPAQMPDSDCKGFLKCLFPLRLRGQPQPFVSEIEDHPETLEEART